MTTETKAQPSAELRAKIGHEWSMWRASGPIWTAYGMSDPRSAEIAQEFAIHLMHDRETGVKELLAALEEIVTEADQSNGGKGAQLPIVLHIRAIAEAAIQKARQL